MAPHHSRDDWLAQSDEQLLADCLVDTYRASGPGGQKRNKTSSAVRLRHAPSGLAVIAEESRSQHENRARALRRLRAAIALRVRRRVEPGWRPPAIFVEQCTATGRLEISIRNPRYPQIVAWVLDALEACGGRVRDASHMLGLGTAQLSRFVAKDEKLRAAANQLRLAAGLGPLRDR